MIHFVIGFAVGAVVTFAVFFWMAWNIPDGGDDLPHPKRCDCLSCSKKYERP